MSSLTVGSAAGSIKELFTKIKAIDAKHGKFDLVLCTGDFFGPPKDDGEEYGEGDEIVQLLNGTLEGAYTLIPQCVQSNNTSEMTAPLECFIMQGEHSLPQPVIEKFAKTGGQLANNVFLLRESHLIFDGPSNNNPRQVGCDDYSAWPTDSMSGWYLRRQSILCF